MNRNTTERLYNKKHLKSGIEDKGDKKYD